MTYRLVISTFISLALLTGCDTAPSKRDTGAVIGGVAGGVLGSQVGGGKGRTAAIIGGTLLGAMIGGNIGQQMDENDRYRAQQTLETMPDNRTTAWRNPNTGYEYAVTPTRTYESSGTHCREYATEALIGGKRETVYGTACRQPDGTWQAAN